jgi:hypothetical protein
MIMSFFRFPRPQTVSAVDASLRAAFGQLYRARFQEVSHPVVSQFSINVRLVIRLDIKGEKPFSRPIGTYPKVFIKRSCPAGRMDLGRGSQHAVEIE